MDELSHQYFTTNQKKVKKYIFGQLKQEPTSAIGKKRGRRHLFILA